MPAFLLYTSMEFTSLHHTPAHIRNMTNIAHMWGLNLLITTVRLVKLAQKVSIKSLKPALFTVIGQLWSCGKGLSKPVGVNRCELRGSRSRYIMLHNHYHQHKRNKLLLTLWLCFYSKAFVYIIMIPNNVLMALLRHNYTYTRVFLHTHGCVYACVWFFVRV